MFRKPLSHYIFLLSFVCLFVFPKGGFKFSGVPITWGYLLLLLLSIANLFSGKFQVERRFIFLVVAWVPFQLIAFFHLFANGFSHTGYLLSFILTFFCFPPMFYLLFSNHLQKISKETLLQYVLFSTRFLIFFGLSLFICRIVFHFFFEIPFLTVNYADTGLLEAEKNIDRGGIYKLFATYNNGNLFGVCMLMVAPLYFQIEKRGIFRSLLRLSLLLTLSRTVWIGLLIFEILNYLLLQKKTALSIVNAFLLIVMGIGSIFLIAQKALNKAVFLFIFDPTLGGRLTHNNSLASMSPTSEKTFLTLSEIVYLGILENFGLLGLISFCLALFLPIIIYFLNRKDIYQHAICLGLFLYTILSISDGCILLIPTMCIYYSLVCFLFSPSLEKQILLNS